MCATSPVSPAPWHIMKMKATWGTVAVLLIAGCSDTGVEQDSANFTDCATCGCAGDDPSTPGAAFEDLQFLNFDSDLAGLQDVYDGNGFRNGIPLESLEIAKALGGLGDAFHPDRVSSDTPEGQFTVFGNLPSPPDRPGPDTPLGRSVFERDGAWYDGGNCFACHAGVANGQVVAGLANTHVDQAAGLMKALALLKIDKTLRAKTKLLESDAEYEELLIYLENIEVTVKETFKFAESRGDNMGPYAVWRRMSRLADPANSGLTTIDADDEGPFDELFASQALGTVDPNPWWNRKYRNVQYWFAEGAEEVASHFAFNFTVPHAAGNENHAEHVAHIQRILDYAAETTSPKFPTALDGDQVALGSDLFHGRVPTASGDQLACASCHGSYEKYAGAMDDPGGWLVHYEDLGLIDVGTDGRYNETLQAFRPIGEYGNQLTEYFDAQGTPELAPQTSIPTKTGYVAPPLVGIWASAPYFHNGSVPTLWQVLSPDSRADVWTRTTSDPFAYDFRQIGLAHTPVNMTAAEYDAKKRELEKNDPFSQLRIDFRSLYATHRPGKSNRGHTFGAVMSDSERCAVITFLKALSGPDMPKGS